ncbi:hypothetical protein [Spectribacter hydrogenoxidans]|uniref:Uncharacterized protein n=1 Tax=Spectribacter hydrogenoxidans TaxID=3075608 RepID=A0ABU3C3A0_9GAMM|nr:hypothetical protein [Salinisphaera sp. W335]MDT0636020.1 hypothetical protein [Salinisphaera sp. W335]
MPQQPLTDRVQAVREVTSLFRVERFVYLAIIVVCLLVLIVLVVMAAQRGEMRTAEIVPMFGSGGVISVMTGRLLHMWNRAVDLLEQPANPDGGG